MRISASYAKKKARIEIIPLIDIIFFLLATFLMVSLSMIKNQGVPVNLPSAATSAPQDRTSELTITITRDGQMYLDKEPVTADQLKIQLSLIKAQKPDVQVFIHGDEAAMLGKMMLVLDRVRQAGIQKVSLQTQPMETAP